MKKKNLGQIQMICSKLFKKTLGLQDKHLNKRRQLKICFCYVQAALICSINVTTCRWKACCESNKFKYS